MDNESPKPKGINYNLPMYAKQELAKFTPEIIPKSQVEPTGKDGRVIQVGDNVSWKTEGAEESGAVSGFDQNDPDRVSVVVDTAREEVDIPAHELTSINQSAQPPKPDQTPEKAITTESSRLYVKNKAKGWFKKLDTNEMTKTVSSLLLLEKGLADNDKVLETRRRLAKAAFSVGGHIFADLIKENSGFGLGQNRLPPRKGFEPTPKYVPSEIKTPEEIMSKPQNPPAPEAVIPESASADENVLKELFDDPSVVKHEVIRGDSVWKMLKETLEHNDQFKNLGGTGTAEEIADQIEAKQTRVLQAFTSEVLKHHDQYGVGPNGEVEVGQKVDFSKLFSDEKHFDDIIKDANSLTPAKIYSINSINDKIETWIRENPGKPVNVDEILNTKPQQGVWIFDKRRLEYQPSETKVPEEDGFMVKNQRVAEPEVAGEKSLDMENAERRELGAMKGRFAALETERMLAEQKFMAPIQEKLQSVLTETQDIGKRPGLRTMSGDIISITKDQIDQAFNSGIDEIYGRKGFLGIGKVEGIKSPEWAFMKTLPANKVLEYFKHPESSDLPKNVINELATSTKHRGLVEQVIGLMEESLKRTGVEIKPYDNGENMEAFVKRAEEFLMKRIA